MRFPIFCPLISLKIFKQKSLTMNQSSYIHDLGERHHLENAGSVPTPCDNAFKDLQQKSDPKLVTSQPYCSLIGALL